MKFGLLLTCAVLATPGVADEVEKEEAVYTTPSTDGLHWADTFDGDAMSRWVASENDKYNGKFEITTRRVEGLVGDVGLLVPEAAKHYGISTSFPELAADRKGEDFVLQFEARFQDGLQCGGGYVKLFDRSDKDAKSFDNDTPYVIMFGPDRCGSTDKIHFILQHKSPKTGKLEEKHFKEPPSTPRDEKTHLYGLVIRPDNSFDIMIDGSSKASGNLLSSMEPPVNPAKEIDDPADAKPGEWVDDQKMADPESNKPDDWDEEEPRMIDDSAASMPDGWLEDASKRIEDPSALKPGDWDDEEDGEWEAPVIDNPACKIGCGKWSPAKINNPQYKGKWTAEMIDNPSYKGVWKPRQIENPDYFLDAEPSMLPKIDSLGIDIWTMQGGIHYDNFVISTNLALATEFTSKTFDLRKTIEEGQNPAAASGGVFGGLVETIKGNLIPVVITLVLVLAATLFMCCRGGAPKNSVPTARSPASPRSPKGEDKDKREDETEDKQTKEDDTKATKETKKGKKAKDEKDEDAAGGVGLSDKKDD